MSSPFVPTTHPHLHQHDDGRRPPHSKTKDGAHRQPLSPPAHLATTHQRRGESEPVAGGTAVSAPRSSFGDSARSSSRAATRAATRAGTGTARRDTRPVPADAYSCSSDGSGSSSTASSWSSAGSSSTSGGSDNSWPDDEYLPLPPPPRPSRRKSKDGHAGANNSGRHCELAEEPSETKASTRTRVDEQQQQRRPFESLYAPPLPLPASVPANQVTAARTPQRRNLPPEAAARAAGGVSYTSKSQRVRRGGVSSKGRFQPPSSLLSRSKHRHSKRSTSNKSASTTTSSIPPRPQLHHLPSLTTANTASSTTNTTSRTSTSTTTGSSRSSPSRNHLFVVPPASTPSAAALASAVASASAAASSKPAAAAVFSSPARSATSASPTSPTTRAAAAPFPSPTEHPRIVHFDLPSSDVVPFRIVQDRQQQQQQQQQQDTEKQQLRDQPNDLPLLSLTSSSGSGSNSSSNGGIDYGTTSSSFGIGIGIGSTVGIDDTGIVGIGIGVGRNGGKVSNSSNTGGNTSATTSLPIQEPTRKARERFASLRVDELDEEVLVPAVPRSLPPLPTPVLRQQHQQQEQQLIRLENVTNQQRALIDPELLAHTTSANKRRKKMPAAPQSSSRRSASVSARARNLLRKKPSSSNPPQDHQQQQQNGTSLGDGGASANGEASSAAASPPRKMKLVKGLGKKSSRSAKKKQQQQKAESSPEPAADSADATSSSPIPGAVSLMSGSLPGGLEQPALVEDRSDAPPLRMRAENGGSGSKSDRKLKLRKDAFSGSDDVEGNGADQPIAPAPAPVQQLRAESGDASGRGRDASPVTTDYGEESAMPEMETPIKSNRGRPTIASRVRSMSRSLSRSRRAKNSDGVHDGASPEKQALQHVGTEDDDDIASVTSSMSSSSSVMSYGQNLRRSLSRSRSARSSSGASALLSEAEEEAHRPLLVAVTSCRSDAYHHQKAPGTTSKLPRKAPSALKMFHELAVGLKDAYEAVGATPTNPADDEEGDGSEDPAEIKEAKQTLWDFMGNLDFLLGLVDEVAIDTATRGALKDDSAFKSLRDVIKKCNKILETMLVRRERKYTLFFRLVQPHDLKEIKKIKSWNGKVEKAVNTVAETKPESDEPESDQVGSDDESEVGSTVSGVSSVSRSSRSSSRSSGVFRRGRSLLPAAGKVRARRATPAPRLRNRHRTDSDASQSTDASADGFAANTAVTPGNLAKLQQSFSGRDSTPLPSAGTPLQGKAESQEVKPKDELVDVIRGLKAEKESRAKGAITGGLPSDLKPNWLPKADIPSAVPKLPIEYIHRHRLMKQVVNCLLDRGTGPRDTDDVDEDIPEPIITTITSRHSDKAGNGKTTLAVAAIQTVEVRERFSDGIAWIHLGRAPLTEKDVRRLYEEIHDQLMKEGEFENDSNTGGDDSSFSTNDSKGASSRTSSLTGSLRNGEADNMSLDNSLLADKLAKSRRRFQGGELEGIKEDLGRMLTKRKVLICLDDVWRVEDAKWFIFDPKQGGSIHGSSPVEDIGQAPYRVLITTRVPSLLSPTIAQEVFVRIFSEHEAVKLLLFAAGRRMYGGKASPVFQQARVIVKGCGNSPLAVRVAGGMLRSSNRNWTLRSPTWTALLSQCKTSLEEASRIRSFQNSVGRIVDLSFVTVQDLSVRTVLRRCFVAFAMSFSDNEWVKVGKGIPKPVVLKLFKAVEEGIGDAVIKVPPESLLAMLETMNLLEKARHGVKAHSSSTEDDSKDDEDADDDDGDPDTPKALPSTFETPCYVMHESIRHLAEDMATRPSSSFIPPIDDYTSFSAEIDREMKSQDGLGAGWSAPLRSAAKYLAQTLMQKKEGMEEYQFHRLVISSLIGVSSAKSRIPSVAAALQDNKSSLESLAGGDRVEAYIAAHMPNHLIRAKMLGMAGELLSDESYISRRVAALGSVEATRRQVADLVELRREVSKVASENKAAAASGSDPKAPDPRPSTPKNAGGNDTPPASPLVSPSMEPAFAEDVDLSAPLFVEKEDVDIGAVQRDASRRIIDEVYRVVDLSNNSGDSLNMAICLSTVGEGLIKSRQPREAMLRLEEAVGIYRGILGPYHIDVARALNSVARALSRLSESRVALLKFAEASRIFEACNATRHFDSIANSQSMASLLVDVGDWTKAEAKYEDVISLRKAVYGDASLQAAKTINDYAVVLAKHSRMDQALRQYEAAKRIYEALISDETSLSLTAQLDGKDSSSKRGFDLSLINLNIASIKSKKGDAAEAIECYEKGVGGLEKYLQELQAQASEDGSSTSRISSTKRHLVSAMGRIGSLKLKQGDHIGALKAYTGLLGLVDADSPLPSRTEKAKALVKCATIYRQRDTADDNELAISHLSEALDMYTGIHGQNHKDTRAIETSLRQWQAQSTGTSTKGGEEAI